MNPTGEQFRETMKGMSLDANYNASMIAVYIPRTDEDEPRVHIFNTGSILGHLQTIHILNETLIGRIDEQAMTKEFFTPLTRFLTRMNRVYARWIMIMADLIAKHWKTSEN